jgi:hypothetical protein
VTVTGILRLGGRVEDSTQLSPGLASGCSWSLWMLGGSARKQENRPPSGGIYREPFDGLTAGFSQLI